MPVELQDTLRVAFVPLDYLTSRVASTGLAGPSCQHTGHN